LRLLTLPYAQDFSATSKINLPADPGIGGGWTSGLIHCEWRPLPLLASVVLTDIVIIDRLQIEDAAMEAIRCRQAPAPRQPRPVRVPVGGADDFSATSVARVAWPVMTDVRSRWFW
jgi:hypothetical protein